MDPDLQTLLALWLGDHDPGDDRRVALLARLRADDAFRRAFVAELYLLAETRTVQSPEPRWLRLEDEYGWSAGQRADADGLAAQVMAAVRRRTRARRVARWSAAVAAAVLVAAGGAFVAWLRPPAPPAETPVIAEIPALPRIEVATVIRVDDIEWAGGDPAPVVGSVLSTGPVRLTAGRLTLAFFSGATLTVEGPADLDLLGADRIVCRRGKLRARVPRGADGFTVLSDRYEVVDLGTEFGVNRDTDGRSQVMVFEGDAAVSLLGANGQPVRGALLERDESIELNPAADRMRSVTPAPREYAPLGRFAPPPLMLAADYPAAVLAARPWGYWRFETLAAGAVANEVPGQPALTPLGGVAVEAAGPGNRAARFRPNDPAQAFLMDGEWTPPRATGYAIEVWARADQTDANSVGRNALVSLIDVDDEEDEKHVAYLEWMGRGRRTPHEPCAVRFLDRWPSARFGGVDLFSRRTVVPTLWRHMVGQKAGDRLELYVDGELVATNPADLNPQAADDPATTACRLLVGRLRRKSLPPNDILIRAFEGRLDELAVYDHPLSADEIKRHAGLRVRP